MIDITKINNNISRIKRVILFLILSLCFAVLISYISAFIFRMKPQIKARINLNLMSKVKNIKDVDIVSNLSRNLIQINTGKILSIESKTSLSLKNKTMDGLDNLMTLPTFKKRVFKGNTDYINYDTNSTNIKIPNKMKLNLLSNPIYYLFTNSFYGKIESGDYYSDEDFVINDIDFYIKGDSFQTKSNLDYIKIKGRAIFKKRNIYKKDIFDFEIYGNIFEIFNKENFAEFFEKIKMIHGKKSSNIMSEYSKIIFHFDKDGNLEVDEMLFLDNVEILTESQMAKSHIGFYDLKKEKIILLGDVKIKDLNNEAITKSNIYIYDTVTEVASSGKIDEFDDQFYKKIKERIIKLMPLKYDNYLKLMKDESSLKKRMKLIIKN